jgi:DnaJ-class molecular chaperone
VTVATPTNLTNEQKKLLKDLAKSLPGDAIPQERGLIDRVRELLVGS